tara:strand:+ start:171 stop:365 length:195 start_codon:yes stop_codon:yes gene_type:complete
MMDNNKEILLQQLLQKEKERLTKQREANRKWRSTPEGRKKHQLSCRRAYLKRRLPHIKKKLPPI